MPSNRNNSRASGRSSRPVSREQNNRRRTQAARTSAAGTRADRRASNGSAPRKDDGRVCKELHAVECNEASLSRRKFIYGGVALAAGAVGLRLGDYQILNGEEYRARADSRRRTSETLYAKRGTIYDRNGNVLTSSVECKNVYVNPPYIKKKDRRRAIDALSEVLGMPRDVVRDLVDSEQNFQYIKRRVDEEDAETLSKLGIEGMGFEPAVKRVYPNGNLASQLLGTVNVDNIGASGIEQHYNDVLTGKNGELSREKALRGGFIAGGEYEKTPAEDGMDLVLSIDVNIQRAAEEAIAEVVERVDAKNGSVMVVDPTNGEILCACSYPTFDPTDTDSADIADFNLRMVTDVYEPGSVFKSFVTAAAIEHEGMTPDTSFNVPAMVRVGDDEVRDADKRDYSMTMTLREMMRRSSNTGLVLVGEKIGADDFDKHVIGDFGFGTSTGIDFPGESLGIIKKRSEYDGATLGSMSFGQALAVEPVQMVRAMSAIANKGVMTTPHFVKARAGEELDWTSGEKRAISAETAAAVASMMLTVVDEGTGELAQVPGYEVSGKTGTAERAAEGQKGYLEDNYMSSFMGFVSTSDPRVLCYVTLDGTAAGSDAATPVFRKIMDTALPTLGIKPTR